LKKESSKGKRKKKTTVKGMKKKNMGVGGVNSLFQKPENTKGGKGDGKYRG